MKLLEDEIVKYGKVLSGDVLKVDMFLNHQINVKLMDEIGKEFSKLFSNIKPNKILTLEASGIAIAQAVSIHMGYIPVVFAKKCQSNNISNDVYTAPCNSYTRGYAFLSQVSKEYLNSNDKILIIDDFLATGQAILSLIDIVKQAKAQVLGIGIVVCKMYQEGYELLKKECNNLEVLAKIKKMSDDGHIEWN